MLHEANVAGDEELRELAEQVGRHAEFSARGAQLEEEIAAIIGDVEFDEIDAELQAGDATQLEARFDALSSQLGEAEGRLKELYQQRGRLAEQTKALESDPRLPTAVMERNGIDEQLRQIAHEWQVLAGTSAILESVRHIYETQRQPATLSDASRYLERMTDGRYKRVWTPLDEDTLLVDDAHGHSLGIEVLSAGTREQVFLAIRLALVSMYARRGAALPLVLDDVLVNCDAVRARAAAKVLCDFANEGHQLLIFTCHEHIVQIFRQLHADVRRLPLRAELGDLAEPPVSDEAEHLVLDAPAPLTDEDVDDDFDDELVEEKEPGALIDEAETDVEDEPLHEDEEPEFESPNLDDSAEQLEDAHPPVSPPAFAWASPSGENAWIEESPAPVDDDEPFAELLQQASPPSAWHAQQVPWEEG